MREQSMRAWRRSRSMRMCLHSADRMTRFDRTANNGRFDGSICSFPAQIGHLGHLDYYLRYPIYYRRSMSGTRTDPGYFDYYYDYYCSDCWYICYYSDSVAYWCYVFIVIVLFLLCIFDVVNKHYIETFYL